MRTIVAALILTLMTAPSLPAQENPQAGKEESANTQERPQSRESREKRRERLHRKAEIRRERLHHRAEIERARRDAR